MTDKFSFEQALEALKAGQPITGKDSVLSVLWAARCISLLAIPIKATYLSPKAPVTVDKSRGRQG